MTEVTVERHDYNPNDESTFEIETDGYILGIERLNGRKRNTVDVFIAESNQSEEESTSDTTEESSESGNTDADTESSDKDDGTPLEETPLSGRGVNALRKEGYETVADLKAVDNPDSLKDVTGVGPATFATIEAIINE